MQRDRVRRLKRFPDRILPLGYHCEVTAHFNVTLPDPLKEFKKLLAPLHHFFGIDGGLVANRQKLLHLFPLTRLTHRCRPAS
jgi:hypothetical protein